MRGRLTAVGRERTDHAVDLQRVCQPLAIAGVAIATRNVGDQRSTDIFILINLRARQIGAAPGGCERRCGGCWDYRLRRRRPQANKNRQPVQAESELGSESSMRFHSNRWLISVF